MGTLAPDPGSRPWRLVAVVAGVILVGSVLPLPPPGEKPLVPVSAADTVVHIVSYAVLAYVLAGGLGREGRRSAAHRTDETDDGRVQMSVTVGTLAVLLAVGYGLGIEGLQTLVPGRRFQLTDVGANGVGAVLGVVVRTVRRRRRVSALTPDGRSDRSP